jgi:CheY-like chemotaxis protein
LIDIGLPEMDGTVLAECLRKQAETARCKLVAVTGYGQESDRQRALKAGFDHYLVKPVNTQQLFAILAEA